MLSRLVTGNVTFHTAKSACIFRSPTAIRQTVRTFRGNSARKCENLFINRPITLALGVGTAFLLKNPFSVVKCEAIRAADIHVVKTPDGKFDWKRFWSYLRRHIWKLLGAVAAALAVAYLNINIPSLLGQLVNSLSKYAGTESGTAKDFFQVKSEDFLSKKKYF